MDNIQTMIDKIIIERNKAVDSAVIMEIQKIAVENGIETKFVLNEKNIISAFEKQIAKKPIKKTLANDGYAWEWICPNCHIIKVTTEEQFCHDCGQAINWSEGE